MIGSFWTWSGWSFFVALGTLSLAGVTAWLAWESRRQIDLAAREVAAVERQTEAVGQQAEATQRQAEVSAASLEASVRPVLVDAIAPAQITRVDDNRAGELEAVSYPGDYDVAVRPLAVHYEERDNMLYLSFCIRNIGAGVAFVQRVALLTRTAYPVRVSPPIIAPNETARILIALTLRQSDGRSPRASCSCLSRLRRSTSSRRFVARLPRTVGRRSGGGALKPRRASARPTGEDGIGRAGVTPSQRQA